VAGQQVGGVGFGVMPGLVGRPTPSSTHNASPPSSQTKNQPPTRFGDFERFIYDFLVGGTPTPAAPAADGTAPQQQRSGIGEGLRLKLQTPIYVADALVNAAGRQLAAEIAAAEGELAALGAVKAQLRRFKDDMRRDGAAQRAAVRDLVTAAVGRAEKFVDRTLQLSNIGAAGQYVFGGPGGAAGLPVARGFDSEVVQGSTDQMASLVAEHAGWLASNCDVQAEYYAKYLKARRQPPRQQQQQPLESLEAAAAGAEAQSASSSSAAAAADPAPPQTSSSTRAADAAGALAAVQATGGGGSAALRAVAEFNLGAAKVLLEEEIREAFLGTAGSAAGVQGLGLLAASWIHNTVEDLLALGVAGLASYVSVLNLPLKRAEIKGKISKIAGGFADSVVEAMEGELEGEVEETADGVLAAVGPLEAAWGAELAALRASEARRAALGEALAAIERRAANLQ